MRHDPTAALLASRPAISQGATAVSRDDDLDDRRGF
jgi:hypothetical protein